MTSKRIAQTNQQQDSEKPQASSILQRAAVRSVSDAGVQSTQDKEAQPLGNSAFSKDFSRVPSTTKLQMQGRVKPTIQIKGMSINNDENLEPEADVIGTKALQMKQTLMGEPELTHVLQQNTIQAKLTIGEPGDKYEQEADRVAQQVVNQIYAPVSQPSQQNLQREEMPEEDELQKGSKIDTVQRQEIPEAGRQMNPMLQLRSREGGMTATSDLETAIQQELSSGQPLADKIRKPMEQAFNADFSEVKVHTNDQSDKINQKLGSDALTTGKGKHVLFRTRAWQPETRKGKQLIAHELEHARQQRQTQNQTASKGVIQRNVGFEFEVPAYEVQQMTQQTEASNLQSKDLNDDHLQKSHVLAVGKGFELQIDTGFRGAHLEFVTSGRGFPETNAGREQLNEAIENIVALGKEITSKIQGSTRIYEGWNFISTREITNGVSEIPETVIYGLGNEMRASPQSTAGIRLDQLPTLMENMVPPQNEKKKKTEKRSSQRSTLSGKASTKDTEVLQKAPGEAKRAITNFKTQMTEKSIKLPRKFGSKSLVGLMALIYTYLNKAETTVPGDLKTLFPLLAHTKFPSMFAMLPDYDQEPFTEDPQRFVDINLNAANMADTGTSAFYSGPPIENDPISALHKDQFKAITRERWLSSIPKGEYLDVGVTKFEDRDGGEQVGQTHPIWKDTLTDAPILELRRMVQPLTINNWKDFSLDIFDFIKQLNDLKTKRFKPKLYDLNKPK